MRGTKTLLMASAFLAALTTGATGKTLMCSIEEKSVCEVGANCRRIPPTTWAELDLAARTYARCDKNGCDRHAAQMSKSGVFTNFAAPERGAMARLRSDNAVFMEVVTLAQQVYVGFGKCVAK